MVSEPIKDGWLTEEAVLDLRKQVALGSVYYSDYENDYGLDVKEVSLFFDGFLSYVSELMGENGVDDFWAGIKDYDTEENLKAWYACHESCPFSFAPPMWMEEAA